jgi:hypothetical protein
MAWKLHGDFTIFFLGEIWPVIVATNGESMGIQLTKKIWTERNSDLMGLSGP